MFEVQGYKKFEDKCESVGLCTIEVRKYQKRVDRLESWQGVPLCNLNDKLFININEYTVETFPTAFSVELVAEGEGNVWADLKICSITQEQIENNLSKYEEKLKKMWVVFNEENSNV